MRCAIWYHLYNFKNVENTHGGVLLLAFFTCFKLYKWYQIAQTIKNIAVTQIKVKIMIIAGDTGYYYRVHEMSKHIAGYIFACCIAMVPSLPLLTSFTVQSISSVKVPVSEYGGALLGICLCLAPDQDPKPRLSRRRWVNHWCFLTKFSCCSHCPTALVWTRALSANIPREATWMPGLK